MNKLARMGDMDIRGMQPQAPPSTSMVNLSLPIQLADSEPDAPPTLFGLAHWIMPRVPCIGELVVIEAIPMKVRIESVWWDADGRALVQLAVTRVPPAALERLEADGWSVGPYQDEPPSEWLAPSPES